MPVCQEAAQTVKTGQTGLCSRRFMIPVSGSREERKEEMMDISAESKNKLSSFFRLESGESFLYCKTDAPVSWWCQRGFLK